MPFNPSSLSAPSTARSGARPIDRGSDASAPATAARSRPASATERASGPCVSRYGQVGMTPVRGTRPKVGFIPTTPVHTAGMRFDPPSSVPSAAKAIPAATATADPALEPPGVRVPLES